MLEKSGIRVGFHKNKNKLGKGSEKDFQEKFPGKKK